MAMAVDDEASGKMAFTMLQPLCTKLLELPAAGIGAQTPAIAVLEPLHKLLEELPSAELQKCMEYVLFPLLLLVDAAVALRSTNNSQNEDPPPRKKHGTHTVTVSDKLAEGVVSCLEIVLKRCPVTDNQQMTMLLRKLAGAAMLSPEEASEEFRHAIIKCLKSMFEQLAECNNPSCCCKNVVLPASISWEHISVKVGKQRLGQESMEIVDKLGDEDCVLGALQSEHMSAAIGHLVSLLLKISHVEAAKSGLGSGAIRADSLLTLRIIMRKVGTADALSFFLPGIASGLWKVIRNARLANQRSTSLASTRFYSVGAAGNSRSVEEAVRGMAELLVLVLADVHNVPGTTSMSVHSEAAPVAAALETLQNLSLKLLAAKQGSEPECLKVLEAEEKNMMERKIMRVKRSKEWLAQTVGHVNTILSDALTSLCAHPTAAVRLAVAEAAGAIIVACQETLKICMPLLLESLLALAYDDSDSVASAATGYISLITSADAGSELKGALMEVLIRLLESLPKAVLAADESIALLHARRLAASMYFAGPDGVFASFFQSPASVSRFVMIMMQSLSVTSAFTGSMSQITSGSKRIDGDSYKFTEHVQKHGVLEDSSANCQAPAGQIVAADQLPRTAPWFAQAGKTKLYTALAIILRLAGFSCLTGCSGRVALTDILDPLQASIRNCAADSSNSNIKENSGTCDMWYESGQIRRSAAAAACVLNEVIYGASGTWSNRESHMFGNYHSGHTKDYGSFQGKWCKERASQLSPYIVDAVGNILHDYMELWDLPIADEGDINVAHLLQDNATLQQILVEGVGIFGIALGNSFDESGFLGLVTYPLLEKLGCSWYPISHAASISLLTVCHHCGYDSVRKLVVANSDHVVDSLCRQLRHITLYPHAPNLLAAVLQQTGAAPDLLPLLEEPMRGMLLELEIPGRHHHPYFTVPILKALREITKAARQGSSDFMAIAVREEPLSDREKRLQKLQQLKRLRLSVLTVATSCLLASAPLLASKDPQACIITLDVIEDGIAALSKIEAAYKHDKMEWDAIANRQDLEDEPMCESFDQDPNEANKLLPTMHQIWPHLVICLRHCHSSVVVKCLHVIASVSYECGGDFLARRFQKDALPLILMLLRDGPSTSGRPGINQIVAHPGPRKELASPAAIFNVQEAVLKCIKAVSEKKKSQPALDLIFETVAAWVVGIACSLSGLKELAVDTAIALSNINADLVWILVTDLAGVRVKQPLSGQFPSCSDILPPLTSAKDALCSQYAGEQFAFKIDHCSACELLAKLDSQQ